MAFPPQHPCNPEGTLLEIVLASQLSLHARTSRLVAETTSRNVRSLLGPVCREPSCIKQRAQRVCRQRRRLHRGCQQGCRRCTDWRRCACAACRTGPAGRTAPPMRPPLPVKTAAPVSLLLCALKPLLAAQTVPPQSMPAQSRFMLCSML